MIRFKHKGNFRHTESFFQKVRQNSHLSILKKYGEAGVSALASATPKESGQTASAWGYEIEQTRNGYSIFFTNSNVNQGVNIAVILQYGHGTGSGGYVKGVDYITPAIRPIFDQIANEAWKEVTSA